DRHRALSAIDHARHADAMYRCELAELGLRVVFQAHRAALYRRSLPDAEPREHLVQHPITHLDPAQLGERAGGFPELDRDDLRGPPRRAGSEGRVERVARVDREGLLTGR